VVEGEGDGVVPASGHDHLRRLLAHGWKKWQNWNFLFLLHALISDSTIDTTILQLRSLM
jgi:hypothetical protein